MAKSKRTGRYYESRRDRGYLPDKFPYKPDRYPAGFNRWGSPIICGVTNADGKECLNRVVDGLSRCEECQARIEEQRRRSGKGRSS